MACGGCGKWGGNTVSTNIFSSRNTQSNNVTESLLTSEKVSQREPVISLWDRINAKPKKTTKNGKASSK